MTLVKLPVFHPDQVKAFKLKNPATGKRARFKAVRCGRRWGKTELGVGLATDAAAKGQFVGWFAPEYRFVAEAYRSIDDILSPVKLSASRDGVYTTTSKGRIDFWSLENENAGRSRKYHLVVIDEAAFAKNGVMLDIWRKSIRPTLLDYKGKAIVLSNTNGNDPENFLWQICNQPEHGFVEYHAPTANNPYLPADEIAKLQAENHPLVYQQEYLAEFVDWSGIAFFSLDKLLVGGQPVPYPKHCDAVFAIVDSATKTGKDNDGTAVAYYAVMRQGLTYKLVVLDWDIVQIEGAMLEVWLPTVLKNLESLAAQTKALLGSLGTFIEDKDSGQILLQQARNKGLKASAIESPLTALGKDGRAISASSYVYRELVKLSDVAHGKVVTYKGVTRNHFVSQVVGYRVGDKEAAKRADDLLDTFTYGIAVALGNAEGF